ncbi:alpha/beta hydrolase [Patescibacteria group bacterium]|nr:alpha/beta hydrolase [Patescibacteria group bacterium]
MQDPVSKQKFSTLFLNFEEKSLDEVHSLKDGEEIWVCFAPICTYHEFPPYKYFLEKFAEFTHSKTIAIDIHGLGKSSRLNLKQSLDLARESNFLKVLDPIFSSLESINAKKVNIYGYSMGGRLAGASVMPAKTHDIDIERMILVEPGGVTKLEHIFGIMGLLNEGRFIDMYDRFIINQKQRDAMMLTSSLAERLGSLTVEYLKPFKGRYENLLLFAASLQSATLERDMLLSLENSNGLKVNIISGERSGISRNDDIRKLLSNIESMGLSTFNKLRWILLEGDSHIVGFDTARLIDAFRFLI